MCLDIHFLGFIHFGICSLSWICRFMTFIIFGVFLAIISLTTFSAALFLLFFQDSDENEC